YLFSLQFYLLPRSLHSFPTRRSSDLTVLLLLPLGTVFLICFWIGQMNLLQSPGSTLAAVACLTVILTGGLAAWEAGRIKTETSPDRKSTRLNSSHVSISYAVFCLKKK